MLHFLLHSERLLSGTLSAYISAVATEMTVNNPPDTDRLPTLLELEPDADAPETVRVIAVAGNVCTIERGVYNGGVGVEHQQNSAYKQKITSEGWEGIVNALENGYLTEDSSLLPVSRDSTTAFTLVGVDHTAFYTKGRVLRINDGDAYCTVVSSSLVSDDTVVVVDGDTVPASVTNVELALGPAAMLALQKIYTDVISEKTSAAGVTIDGVLLKDSQVTTDVINEKTGAAGVTVDGMQIKDSEPYTDEVNEKTGGAGVTVDGVLVRDGKVTGDLIQTPAPSADTTASGVKVSLTAGENLVFGEVCYIKSDGKAWKADASVIATSCAVVIALATISADAAGEFLLLGWIRDDSWTWTVGGLIYLSTTAGDLTQTAPSATDEVIQIVGVATHADRMLFNPSLVQVEHT